MTTLAIFSILANISTTIAVGIGAWQLILGRSIAKAQFLLELERMSKYFDDIHIKLRPSGDWQPLNGMGMTLEDLTEEQIAILEDYMGFFEHCNYLLKKGVIEFEMFNNIFGYRVENLVSSGLVREKIKVDGEESWSEFIELCERLGLSRTVLL